MQNESPDNLNWLIRSLLLEITNENVEGSSATGVSRNGGSNSSEGGSSGTGNPFTYSSTLNEDPTYTYTRTTYMPGLSSTSVPAPASSPTPATSPAASSGSTTSNTFSLSPSNTNTHTDWNTLMVRQQNLMREVLYDFNNSYSEYTRQYTQIIQVLREMNQILLLNMENTHAAATASANTQSTQQPAPHTTPIGTSSRRPRATAAQSSTSRPTSRTTGLGGRTNGSSSSLSGLAGSTYRVAANPFQTFLSNYVFPIRIQYSDLSDNEIPPLTSQEIENATEMVTYGRHMNEMRCPISWEEFQVGERIIKIRHCGHIFKTSGLINWLRSNSQCPVCRYNLREYAASRAVASERRERNRQESEDEDVEDYVLDNSVD
jgi:hypothetical protein